MKKVISFSLWGNNPKYTIGAIKNTELAKQIYPGWETWFYCGQSVPTEIIKKIHEQGGRVIHMDTEGDWTGMFWRFYPASDPEVDVMLSRDTDSRLSFREKHAVDEWLKTDKSFHIMRDHPAHATEILGGMWGVRGNKLKDLSSLITSYQKGNFWQVDQNFLREKVYPLVRFDCVVHDEFFEKKPFPTKRENSEFVGDVFDENDIRHPEYWKDIK